MQLSDEECVRVSRAWLVDSLAQTDRRELTGVGASLQVRVLPPNTSVSNPAEMERLRELMSHQPDEREAVVASLRARIESGDYQVSGHQIAEMMVRRFFGDKLR